MPTSFPCPKCGALLECSGEVTVGGETLPVFQCDDCIVNVPFGTSTVEVNYTFAVNSEGEAVDATSLS